MKLANAQASSGVPLRTAALKLRSPVFCAMYDGSIRIARDEPSTTTCGDCLSASSSCTLVDESCGVTVGNSPVPSVP
jgi:hypothetical protein